MAAHKPILIAQHKQLRFDRIDQRGMITIRKIRAADRTLEQHVTNLREFRGMIDEDDMAWRVAGAVQYVKDMRADIDALAFDEPAIGK